VPLAIFRRLIISYFRSWSSDCRGKLSINDLIIANDSFCKIFELSQLIMQSREIHRCEDAAHFFCRFMWNKRLYQYIQRIYIYLISASRSDLILESRVFAPFYLSFRRWLPSEIRRLLRDASMFARYSRHNDAQKPWQRAHAYLKWMETMRQRQSMPRWIVAATNPGVTPMQHATRISESLKANPSPLSSKFLHTVITHITARFCSNPYR